ncbi:hypothetical protein FO519_007716 [Halicephalobus sp. NKZ332]|nr:hypothetical protein FO519_007716 [Halicephalobus sp. NKZ332]
MGNDSSKSSGGSQGKSGASGVINSLKSGPSNSVVQKHLETAKKSRVLQLKGSNMKTVPNILVEVAPLLRNLDLSQNRIPSLPPFFGQFEILKQLHLNDNLLTSVPDELGNLKKLEVLNLSGNQLTSLPETLVGCLALTNLNVSENRFAIFPVVICLLPRVDIVDISKNEIQELPNEIDQISVTELNINHNKLTTLNPALASTKKMRILRVESNQLPKKAFTKELLEESQLTLIEFSNNHFQQKDFQGLEGYEKYEERFTANRRKGVY